MILQVDSRQWRDKKVVFSGGQNNNKKCNKGNFQIYFKFLEILKSFNIEVFF